MTIARSICSKESYQSAKIQCKYIECNRPE